MKNKSRKMLAIFFVLIMLIPILPAGTIVANAETFTIRNTAPTSNNVYYYSSKNPFYSAGYSGQCTWYAYGRAYEILGKKPNLCLSDAKDWYGYNKNCGYYKYGQTPKVGAIVCWSNGTHGHVGVVEKVISNTDVYISEANVDGGNWRYRHYNPITWNSGFQGYIYLLENHTVSKPSAPKNLNVTTNNGKLNISWSAAENATSYLVYIYTKSNCSEYALKKEVTGTSLNNISIAPGRYWIYVHAMNSAGSAGCGPYNYITGPNNVVASCKERTMKVRWDNVPGANCYDVIVTDPSGTKAWYHSNSNERNINITKTGNYKIEVQSLYRPDGSTNNQIVGAHSSEIICNVGLFGPANVRAEVINNKFKITWDAVSGANCYDVIVTDSFGVKNWYHSISTSKEIPIDKPCEYKFEVQSLYRPNGSANGQIVGAYSNVISYNLSFSAPQNITVDESNGVLNFSWDDVLGATCFDVVMTKPNGEITYLHSHSTNASFDTSSEKVPYGDYSFWIQAIYRANCPDKSNQIGGEHSENIKYSYIKQSEVHSHVWNKGVITQTPTCIQKGIRLYTCTECGKTKKEAIDKLNHTVIIDKSVTPTCTKTGLTQGSHCSVCGYVITAQDIINAKGHSFTDYVNDNNATCLNNGTKTAKCNRCNATDTIEKENTATGHSYENILTKATLTADGSIVTKCSACGDVKSSTTIYYPKSISLSKTSFTYNGKVQQPNVTVKDSNGTVLKHKRDYKVTYQNSINPGIYNVKIEFIGNYSGTKNLTYNIKPRSTSIKSVSGVVNGFKVNWTKVSETTGYQIQYSTRSDFKGAATVYGGATNTTSKTITGRAAGTKYYVRVRTYRTLADGSRVWGNWTSAKAVTTKVKKATAKSVTGISKGFKVTWDKIGGVTGYQVQYATRSDFRNAATVYAGNSSAVSKTITGRARNTKYYVRVRGYKNNKGSYVYGAWSGAKAVKTK